MQVARAIAVRTREGAPVDSRTLARLRRWASRNAKGGETPEVRRAAATLLAVLRDPPRARKAENGANGRQAGPRIRRLPVHRWPLNVLAGSVVLLVALALTGFAVTRSVLTPSFTAFGPPQSALVGAGELESLAFGVAASPAALEKQRWTLDGISVNSQVHVEGNRLVYRPKRLADGQHEVTISGGPNALGLRGRKRFGFTVDTAPPSLRLDEPLRTVALQPLKVSGSVDRDATLTLDGRPVDLRKGRFTVTVPQPLSANLTLVAADPAGNRRLTFVPVTIVPRRPAVGVRAAHMTADSWANARLRRGVLALVAQHRINAVEIDLKDERGVIGFDPAIPRARRIGAAQPIYNLAEVIGQLHARGIRVIGRIVCFRDPIDASAAWRSGRQDEVVQTPAGKPYAGYGGFSNPASPAVRSYNIAVAVAAARMGIDDILYDYVRRPDGPLTTMVFPGVHGSPTSAIVEFLKETRRALRPYGTYLGASVFGVAATRPDEVAQNIPEIARQVDYVAPMVYPSHWNPGEYGVGNPNAEPYKIVLRSVRDFELDVAGTGARIVPWLQDFSLGVRYGPARVRAEIAAAARAGAHEYLLWDPEVTYTAAALSPDARASTKGLRGPTGVVARTP